jgi:selenophosphate synthetase-related protein
VHDVIERYVKSLDWIRERLEVMDDLIKPLTGADPVMGIRSWDDSVCVDFEGRLVVSVDGPYTKRLVLKSALVHAATDVVVKGGRPLFALDALIGSRAEVEEMVESLRGQALALGFPILGGNTLFEDVEPRCSLTVVGGLVLDEPVRDSTAESGDVIALLGEPIWGEQPERLERAKTLFETWFTALDEGVVVHAAKDVTKGGLVSVVYEMEGKSGRGFNLREKLPYPLTRNLDNFILALPEGEFLRLKGIAGSHGCGIVEIGLVE